MRRLNHVKYNTVGTTLQLLCLESEQKGHDLCFKVIQVTLTQGTLKNPKIFSLLKLLKDLAHQGYPRAVFLQGQIFEQEGKLQEALQFYQEWTDIFAEARQSPPFSDSMDTRDLANISKALARLQARFGDLTGAEEAIRDAALAYDDPAAYYYLAVDFTAPGSKDFETYLLRAASAGQAKAAHELGSLYVNRSRQGIPPTSTNPVSSDKNAPATPRHPTTPPTQTLPRDEILSLRATAAEWFAVAAAAGLTASQIGLALLSRAAGRADEGFASLQSASQSKHAGEWTEGIDYLKKIWRHPDAPDLMQVDIESLRKSSSKNGKKNKKSGGLSLSDDVSSSLTESERSMGPLT